MQLVRCAREKLASFFEGYAYPVSVCLMVFIGHMTGYEFYINILGCCLFVLALMVSDSLRPMIPFALTFIYQVSVKNTPCSPVLSDYYFTGPRLIIVICLAALLLFGFVFYIVKTGLLGRIGFKNTPLLLPLLCLSAIFLLNGLGADKYTPMNLLFGGIQVFSFFLFFVLMYHGLERENPKELFSYFCYITTLISLLLIAEVVLMFLNGNIINEKGQIVKNYIFMGWGVCTTIGTVLSVLIPLNFYRAIQGKFALFHFLIATALLAAVILTMSRNALLFGGIAYLCCLIISCVYGKNRKAFRVGSLLLLIGALVGFVLFRENIMRLLSDYFERGFMDNGRFVIWRNAMWAFRKNPIFGAGFFIEALELLNNYGISLFPVMVHNTPIQFLASTGVVGLVVYALYRIMTLRPFFRHPSLEKSFLGIAILMFLAECLLDVFAFMIYPLFYYNIALIIALLLSKEDEALAEQNKLSALEKTKRVTKK